MDQSLHSIFSILGTISFSEIREKTCLPQVTEPAEMTNWFSVTLCLCGE
jgi:hypothetical protein